MASLAKSARASMDATTGMKAPQISGLIAGAAIAALAACYIKAADGKVYPTDATASDEKAVFAGICPRAANAGEPVTLFGLGTVFKYSDALLTPGAIYYLDVLANAGGFADAATVGDPGGVIQAITASTVRIVRNITSGSSVAVANPAAGVAAGYKVARGSSAVTGTLDLNTGLATVVSIVAILGENAALAGDAVTATLVGGAGHALLAVWKRTAAGDCTPIAATVAKTVLWVAVGT